MSTISVSLPADGTVADVSDYNSPITTLVNDYNGNIDNSNIAAAAAISTSKLASDGGIGATMLSASAIFLGSASITASVGPTSTSTSDVDVTGLAVTVTVPSGSRRVLIMATGGDYEQSAVGTAYGAIKVKEGSTVLNATSVSPATANFPNGWTVFALLSGVSAGSHTYKVSVAQNSTGPTYTIGASATNPAVIAAFVM